jgi:hypothetical protein
MKSRWPTALDGVAVRAGYRIWVRLLACRRLGLAVKKILRGYQRHQTERMLGFRSHWGFQGEYGNPAHGNETGGVENELGWFRRNWIGVDGELSVGLSVTFKTAMPAGTKPLWSAALDGVDSSG